ncbi:hypothetical protein ACFX2J_023226 [Malus domestica]
MDALDLLNLLLCGQNPDLQAMVRKLQWWRRWGPRDEDGDNLESEKDMVLDHIFMNVTEGGNWNESLGSKHHGHVSRVYMDDRLIA